VASPTWRHFVAHIPNVSRLTAALQQVSVAVAFYMKYYRYIDWERTVSIADRSTRMNRVITSP